ncbi:hypothetical protein ANO14919_053990 [Xylariales sp. No.14919]|nr:hypothetical protein ANO14919_053990 [Xylariales sp. No.14919]
MDAWAVYAGSTPQQDLLKQVTGYGYSRSDRRDTKPSAKQIAAIQKHPRVVALKKELKEMRVGAETRHALHKKLYRFRMSLRWSAIMKNKKVWTKNQAI